MNQNNLSGLTGPMRHPTTAAGAAAGALTVGPILDTIHDNDQALRRAQAEHVRLLDQARVSALAEADTAFYARTTPAGSTPSAHSGAVPAKLVLERGFAVRSLIAELATMLHLAEAVIVGQLYDAQHLTEHLPNTLTALHNGLISLAHVREITRESVTIPDVALPVFESAALPLAVTLTVPRLRHALQRLSESLSPDAVTERIHRNRSERRVHIESDRDGMAWLHLYLPIEHVAAIQARLGAMGTHLAHLQTADNTGDTENDTVGSTAEPANRTRPQIEADIAADLLEHGQIGAGAPSTNGTCTDGVAPVRPVVYVTVPALTLTGTGTEPGELDGLGPIDPDTARRLTANAPSFHRILTHPETGAYLSYGRDSYRVPAGLKGYLQLRDQHCRFPGCGRAAHQCDIDHTTDWQHNGHTTHNNLAHLCQKHHRLKHHSAWTPEQKPDGTLQWTSPHGRIHNSTPAVTFPAHTSNHPAAHTTMTATYSVTDRQAATHTVATNQATSTPAATYRATASPPPGTPLRTPLRTPPGAPAITVNLRGALTLASKPPVNPPPGDNEPTLSASAARHRPVKRYAWPADTPTDPNDPPPY